MRRTLLVLLLLMAIRGVAVAHDGAAPDWSEPVVIRAGDLGITADDKHALVLQVFHGTALQPLVFQRDAADKIKALPPLGTDDQLIWLASEMGDRAPAEWSKNRREKTWELELSRGQGDSRWVYATLSSETPAVSGRRDVVYDPAHDNFDSPVYFFGFHDVFRSGIVSWKEADGGRGPNLMRGLSVHFKARAFFGVVPMEVSEDDMIARQVGFKQGPIRAIKRIESAPRLPFGFKAHKNITDYVFYRNLFESEVRIKFPAGARVFLRHPRFRLALDLEPRSQRTDIRLPEGKLFQIDAALKPGLYRLQESRPSWVHFSGEGVPASFVTYFEVPRDSEEIFVPQTLFYEDGRLYSDVQLRPRKGEFRFALHLFVLPQTPEQKPPQEFLAEIERYLQKPFRLQSVRLIP